MKFLNKFKLGFGITTLVMGAGLTALASGLVGSGVNSQTYLTGTNGKVNISVGFGVGNLNFGKITTEYVKDDVIIIGRPHMGSEDFAYYQEEIPGVMFMLGCAQEDCITGTLHSSELNVNEAALPNGINIFVNVAMSICGIKE